MGAAASNGSNEKIEFFRKLGEKVGIAFQLKDDLFDYGSKKIGKPIWVDLKEKKLTLPIIYSINNSSKSKKRWLINSIKNHSKDSKVIKEVIDYVKDTGGIEYTNSKLMSFHQSALSDLKKLDDSEYNKSLKRLINYVIEREY